MNLLSAVEVERIYRKTDELELHRDWVVVPLNSAEIGMELEMVLPDGRILIRLPGRDAFEPWLRDLQARLAEIGLSRTPRRSVEDPSKPPSGRNGSRSFGTRGYLGRQPDLNVCDDHSLPRFENGGGTSHGIDQAPARPGGGGTERGGEEDGGGDRSPG